MMRYCALLRGIGPLNPNMRNEKLRGVFESLGFANVSTVITTGNVIFDSDSADVPELETRIEAAWPDQLGFTSTTIIRSDEQIRDLVASEPFGELEDKPTSRLEVTFLKHEPEAGNDFPYTSDSGDFTILGLVDRAIYTVVDLTRPTTPPVMRWINQRYGKEITTRAWTTVNRIARRLEAS